MLLTDSLPKYRSLLALAVACFFQGLAMAEEPEIAARYEKREHRIRMRDGVELYTVVYLPRDRSRPRPILLQKTPYGAEPYGAGKLHEQDQIAPGEAFLRENYILVLQEARGTHSSGGDFTYLDPSVPAERHDVHDTIEWLVTHVPGNNGRVGMWGISYPGWYAMVAAIEPHPALAAVSPQATTADPFIGDDNHYNGAFYLGSLTWAWGMTHVTSGRGQNWLEDLPAFTKDYESMLNAVPLSEVNHRWFARKLSKTLWEDMIEHPNYDDYWQARDLTRYLKGVKLPVLLVGGWFDHCDPYGTFAAYRAIEAGNPANRSSLIAGPWKHGGWQSKDASRAGIHDFGSNTAETYRSEAVFPFFQRHLCGEEVPELPEALVFETGRNRWHRFEAWPPPEVRPKALYLHAGGGLDFEAPRPEARETTDKLLCDPSRPVPMSGDPWGEGSGSSHMLADHRYATTRPDVLVYRTEPLAEDLTIAGPVEIEIHLSTTGTDADCFVKLIDVHPEDGSNKAGYQELVNFQVLRAKYRESFSKPSPLAPGKVTPLRFQIWDRMHTFRAGHRIMVHIHGSWFPLFDRNPHVFTNIYRAAASGYQTATHTIHRSSRGPSHLVLPVFQRGGR